MRQDRLPDGAEAAVTAASRARAIRPGIWSSVVVE